MKFSIIVPIYNSSSFLANCIESVLAQTYDNFELILVDDGSTDNSYDICCKYAGKDKRVFVFRKENSGQIESRCYGLKKSVGEYIVFLDSDDLLAKDALKVISEKFIRYKCDMLIYGYDRFTDEIRPLDMVRKEDVIIKDKRELYLTIVLNDYNSMWRKAIKKDLCDSDTYLNFKEVKYGEDLLQTLEIIRHNPKTVIINDVLYHYRLNYNSVTRSIDLDRYSKDTITVISSVYEFLKTEGFSEESLSDYRNKAIYNFCGALSEIAQNKCDFGKKIRIIKQFKDNNIYKDFLNKGKCNKHYLGKKYYIWILFQWNMYFLLVALLSLKGFLKR